MDTIDPAASRDISSPRFPRLLPRKTKLAVLAISLFLFYGVGIFVRSNRGIRVIVRMRAEQVSRMRMSFWRTVVRIGWATYQLARQRRHLLCLTRTRASDWNLRPKRAKDNLKLSLDMLKTAIAAM